MCWQLLALHSQRHVHKLLLAQQTLEGRDQLPLVIVPAEIKSVNERAREVGPVLSSPFQAVSLLGAHGGELGLAEWSDWSDSVAGLY